MHGQWECRAQDTVGGPHDVLLRGSLLDDDESRLQSWQLREHHPIERVAALREVARTPDLVCFHRPRGVLGLGQTPGDLVLSRSLLRVGATRWRIRLGFRRHLCTDCLGATAKFIFSQVDSMQRLCAVLLALIPESLELVWMKQEDKFFPSLGHNFFGRLGAVSCAESQQLLWRLSSQNALDLSDCTTEGAWCCRGAGSTVRTSPPASFGLRRLGSCTAHPRWWWRPRWRHRLTLGCWDDPHRERGARRRGHRGFPLLRRSGSLELGLGLHGLSGREQLGLGFASAALGC
mmetsp:Transcript_105422/g.263881  ORF Transcript_105422/g.263881 Transcript_105422/m.263881 type:complete len:290 (-) Transcript_105422:381-1250(-)